VKDVSPSQSSLVVSILSAGTFFGALAAAPFADFLGRRLALLVSAGIVFNFGVILQTASTALPMFIAGRFFAGFGVGLISALSKSLFVLRQYLYLPGSCGRRWTCG
jgi:SP family sugar:H+ symporter-like MFS transporter